MRCFRVPLGVVPVVLPLLLSGCGPEIVVRVPNVVVVSGAPAPLLVGAAVMAATGVASITIFHRTLVDMVVSVATGRDCSVVNLDRGERYCRPQELPPEPPEFCTRSLGVVDCWANPAKLPGHPREVADGPRTLTAEQEADRTAWWPGL
jgi:hypothetical protein